MEEIQLGPHQVVTIVESTPEVLRIEARWEPGGLSPIPHLHPSQEERFEVLEGALTVTIDDEERVYAAGESFVVAAGTAHGMWNASDAPAAATWEVRPALGTHEMFRVIAGGGAEDFLERFAGEFVLAV